MDFGFDFENHIFPDWSNLSASKIVGKLIKAVRHVWFSQIGVYNT